MLADDGEAGLFDQGGGGVDGCVWEVVEVCLAVAGGEGGEEGRGVEEGGGGAEEGGGGGGGAGVVLGAAA